MASKRWFKRVLACGDFHCGHVVGLTPPEYLDRFPQGSNGKHHKFDLVRRAMWEWFAGAVDALRPIDILFVNGDLLDGRGRKSGGTEQLTGDRIEQCHMAEEIIEFIGAKSIVLTYGTAYHVGDDGEDFEDLIARNVKAKIGAHEWPEVNGTVFDLKHEVGSSSIPHGRATALSRAHLWNQLWADAGQQPKARYIIRSHVHYHAVCGGPGWTAMTLPALQGMGSKYGSRRCEGMVDFGFVHFDCYPGGESSWQAHLGILQPQRARTLPL